MSEHTGISWCHHTLNLWWGCDEVSPACDNCYARRDAARYGYPNIWGHDAPRRFFDLDKRVQDLLGWNRKAAAAGERRRVFINSMSDIGEQHPHSRIAVQQAEARDRLWQLVPRLTHLDLLLLTKRPANYPAIVPPAWLSDGAPKNVWFGITAEDDRWLQVRSLYMARLRPFVHRIWISYEPALGQLTSLDTWTMASLFDWLIAGFESGPGFREEDLALARRARDVCARRGIPFFFKQHAGLHPKLLGDQLDGRQHHQIPEAT